MKVLQMALPMALFYFAGASLANRHLAQMLVEITAGITLVVLILTSSK